MKQKILSICAAMALGVAQSYGGVVLSIPEVTIIQGENANVVINFELGTAAYTAYQFDIDYPDGISSESTTNGCPAFEQGNVYSATHIVSSIYTSKGLDRFQCFSIVSDPLTAQSGTLLTLPIKAARTLAVGTYQATISPIEFVMTDATPDRPEAITFNIKVLDEAATVIETKSCDSKASTNYYNLQGLPVNTPTKGVYIKDGRKVVIK